MVTPVGQAVPLQPMEVQSGAEIHLQLMEDPPLEQVDVPKRVCDPMGSLRWSRFAGKICDPTGGPTLEQSVPEGLHPPHGWDPTLKQFVKICSPGEGGLILEKTREECLPWEEPHAGAGEECEEFCPRGGRSGRDNV
ncbi:hypothetical protein HGM15179_001306 [Zosterops borbonicus]|uniref:Uncharacterized protein n=1 Tax=Zosterops borbonicus TaxID=364589 RepID=A0A8K1GYQ1_9PASS|nr:hypothetical protein HGM15179_001306 [Zosterops borbonicus]